MAQFQFNAAEVKPSEGAEAIPKGWYNMMIDDSSIDATNDGKGAYIKIRCVVLDGQFQGRKIFGRFNVKNENATTVEIARGQISALCHATGRIQLNDTAELHNIPFKAKVKYRPETTSTDPVTGKVSSYDASNDIVTFKHINEQVDMGSANAPTPAAPAPTMMGMGAPVGGQPWNQAAPQQAYQPPAQAPAQAWQPPAAQPAASAPQAWQQPQAQQPWSPPAQAPAGPPPGWQPPAQAPAGPPPGWQPPAQQQPPQQAWANNQLPPPGQQQPQPGQQAQPPAPMPPAAATAQSSVPPWQQNQPR